MNFQLAIGIVLATIIATLTFMLDSCNDEKLKLQAIIMGLKADKKSLKQGIKTQNDMIEKLEIDVQKAKEKWEKKPPRTVYIPADVNITRGDCNDTKNIINAIRNIDF